MRIVCMSDTHLTHEFYKIIVPEGDVLVHAGDATFRGTKDEIDAFAEWFGSLPHKRKLFVPGNHDILFQGALEYGARILRSPLYRPGPIRNIELLCDSGVTIDGVKFWGSPWQPEFMNWAFNLPRGAPLRAKWAMIPDDTNVLITHGPAYSIGDNLMDARRVGCEELLERVIRLEKLRLHVFGHIHSGHGVHYLNGATSGKTFVNASICDPEYKPTNSPIVIDL